MPSPTAPRRSPRSISTRSSSTSPLKPSSRRLAHAGQVRNEDLAADRPATTRPRPADARRDGDLLRFRLADANDLARPTILLGALGRPTRGLTRSLVNDFDIRVNQHFLDRLETFTEYRQLGSARRSPACTASTTRCPRRFPRSDPPGLGACTTTATQCAARLPAQHTIRVYSLYFPKLCRKHRVWLADRTDLTNTPEIITAHRRYGRLLAATGDRQWAYGQLHRATQIIMDWVPHSYRLVPRLHERWEARGKALPGFLLSCGN
ncbi:hypothetical protein [Salinispora arenicola]|uniref:hypothetical protein n=1 Tax=Salinispora arenicola TaxID=168697 RepID=UPI0016BBD21E|nr:hypothetical protein [Salinispora arenicola]NIL63969.1 hypothetical protein [Salinispora arenicola]